MSVLCRANDPLMKREEMLTLSFESMNFEKHRLSCKMEPRVKLKMQMVQHLVFPIACIYLKYLWIQLPLN